MLKTCYQNKLTEAGCDEAGRGSLAGPVFAAAVILPQDFYHPLLNDSKQVAENDRKTLRTFIEENAIDHAVAMVDNHEIDKLNILRASFKAMHLALDKLKKKRPQLLLIDGNRFIRYKRLRHHCIIKGDAEYASISAASILAKTYRDDFMQQLHQQFPYYGWFTNKGYGTEEHVKAIEKFGYCDHHRRTFHVQSLQQELF